MYQTPHRQAGKQHEPRTSSSYRAGDSDAVGMRRAALARFPRRTRHSISPTVGNPAGGGYIIYVSHVRYTNGKRKRHFDAVMPEHMGKQIIPLECTTSLRLVILIDLLQLPWPFDHLFTLLPQICRERERSWPSHADCKASLLREDLQLKSKKEVTVLSGP